MRDDLDLPIGLLRGRLMRLLEGFADHGVDVAEHTVLVATGEATGPSSDDPQ